jgi:DisA bacterial checkpoint controller nucleotide-binding
MAGEPDRAMDHAYPHELSRFAIARWNELAAEEALGCSDHASSELPPPAALELLLSTAYQASLLREEERMVTFRLILGSPEDFPAEAGPPAGLHRLLFTRPRPFSEHELRRLSPAAKYQRSLIGVSGDGNGGFQIWGLLQSGPRWLRAAQGGRGALSTLPPSALVVRVTGPGRLAVARGSVTVCEIRGGRIKGRGLDVFESRWLPARFVAVRDELAVIHEEARDRAGAPWVRLDADVTRLISQQMLKRVVANMRQAHHGGTLIILPPDAVGAMVGGSSPLLRAKYSFSEEEPRRRFRTLILAVMNTLAQEAGRLEPAPELTGWSEYESSTHPQLANLDEAIFEVANLIAGLAEVDGAVLLTQRFEVLGFACEIVGDLADVRTVRRALDLEATQWKDEPTDGVGTRHRSAYRLCERVHGAIAVVVSQDGTVHFVTWKDEAVTYWNHTPAGAADG